MREDEVAPARIFGGAAVNERPVVIPPVYRILRPEDDLVPQRRGGVHGILGIGARRGREQRRLHAAERFHQLTAEADLFGVLFIGKFILIAVEIAVIAQLVPAGGDLPQHLRVPVRPAPADKEGRLHAVFVERIEDGREIFRAPVHVEHDGYISAVLIAAVIDAVGQPARRRHPEGEKADRPHGEEHRRKAQIGDDGDLCIPFQSSLPLLRNSLRKNFSDFTIFAGEAVYERKARLEILAFCPKT